MLDKIIAACDSYNNWYIKSRWGDYNLPNCPLCNSNRKYFVLGPPSLTSYRYQNARVTMRVVCTHCHGRMLASTSYGTKKWTYFTN